MNFEDTPEFKLGRWAEDLVEQECIRAGFKVDRTADHAKTNGRGPRVIGTEGALVLPDFRNTWRGTIALWLEVKGKTQATLGRNSGKLEHGIDLKSWTDCHDIRRDTGEPVFLVICEKDTGCILARDIARLTPRADCPTLNRGKRMMLFAREQFREGGIDHLVRIAERLRLRREPGSPQDALEL